jgi:hypothetical protein
MHIQNDHRTTEPDEKRASGNNTTGSQHTNIKTTLSGRVSTTSVDRITSAGQCDDVSGCHRKSQMQIAELQNPLGLVTPRREKRPCVLPATFVTTCDHVPGHVTHVSYSLREAKDFSVLRPSSKEKNAFAAFTAASVLSFEKVVRGQGALPLRQTPAAYRHVEGGLF